MFPTVCSLDCCVWNILQVETDMWGSHSKAHYSWERHVSLRVNQRRQQEAQELLFGFHSGAPGWRTGDGYVHSQANVYWDDVSADCHQLIWEISWCVFAEDFQQLLQSSELMMEILQRLPAPMTPTSAHSSLLSSSTGTFCVRVRVRVRVEVGVRVRVRICGRGPGSPISPSARLHFTCSYHSFVGRPNSGLRSWCWQANTVRDAACVHVLGNNNTAAVTPDLICTYNSIWKRWKIYNLFILIQN